MAVTQYLDKTGLTYFWSKIKAWCNSLFALDSAVVHKTGNETVAGDKTFTGYITLNKSAPGLALKNTNISKGTKPSAINYYGIPWTDTNGISVENRLGLIETSVDTSGNTSTYFRAYKNASGSSANVSMGVCYDYDASSGYTFAPTPATGDNSTKIATTAFVKAQGYLTSHQTLPSLSLTTSGSGNAITALSVSNHAITATKGTTFLTSHQSLADYAKLASPAFTGTPTTTTAANRTNTTQIATTAFVTNNAARYITANTTIYASTSAAGNGSGSSAANAMSIVDLQTYLASAKMMPSTTSLSGSYRLTILFVPTGSSYGDVTFDFNKMPGIRYLTIGTSTGTASTTSNYTTNSPLFNNLTVSGSPLMVTVNNIQVNGTIKADYGGQITLGVYAGFARLYTNNYGRIDVGNGTYNIHNGGTNCLCYAAEHGQIILNTATMTFNFREQCYFTTAIFAADAIGRIYVNYGRSKFTGTKPVVTQAASGTKTGTSATAAGTAAKVVTLAEGQTFTLANNAVAYVTFDNTNTAANPTLNINSTGAKPIYFNDSAIPANYINKHVQYKFTYNGTQYVCNNTFQRVEQIQSMSLFSYGSNYNTTYNSGEWNWDGFSRYWGNGCWVNNNFQGNLTGNVTGNVTGNLTGNASTATKLLPQAAAALPTGNLAQDGLQLVEVYNNSYPYNYGNVINVQGTTHRGAGQLFLAWSGNDNGIANIYYRNKRDSITSWSDWKQIAFTDSAITGNAGSATKLATARTINGTSFDGSANITTTNWGTARNISISDSDGTNTGTAVSVNGSGNATLKLPATIKASITGNCSGTSSNVTGTVAIANGGTGATTRLNAVKALTNENVGTNATHFLTITDSWGKAGYTTVANAKTVLGLKSAAYTESSAYAAYFKSTTLDVTSASVSSDQWYVRGWMDKNGITIVDQSIEFASSSAIRHFSWRIYDKSKTQHWLLFLQINNDGTSPLLNVGGTVKPQSNNTMSLGNANYKWTAVYATNGTIQTSDARLKSSIENIPDAVLDAWENVDWIQYQLKDAIEKKGDSARIHSGLIAQDLNKIFTDKNIDISRYGMFCYDEWDAIPDTLDEKGNIAVKGMNAGNAFSIRYDEALCIEAAYQRRKNKMLEKKISDLEEQLSSVLEILNNLKGA